MAKQIYTNVQSLKTYKTFDNAVKAAEKTLSELPIRFLICATPDGRFMPVAIGQDAIHAGVHCRMPVCF